MTIVPSLGTRCRFSVRPVALLLVVAGGLGERALADESWGDPCWRLKEEKHQETIYNVGTAVLAVFDPVGIHLLRSSESYRLFDAEEECIQLLNERRKAAGLPPLPGTQFQTRRVLSQSAPLQQQEIKTGNFPVDLVPADFNGDGQIDLAVANQDSDNVSIVLATGPDAFGSATNYPVGDAPVVILSADFNKDNRPDVVTANSGPAGSLSVLIGNGDGTFQTAQDLSPGTQGVPSAAVADFNKDGNPDLAHSRFNATVVTLLLGNGNGTFQPGVPVQVGSSGALATADFNHDNNPDLAVGGFGPVFILLGNGDGSFRNPLETLVLRTDFAEIRVADLNKDGHLDLVTANYTNDSVSVLLGRGDGTFQTAQHYSVNDLPDSISVVDIDEDGYLDILASNYNAAHSSILFNNGDGTFHGARAYRASDQTAGPDSVAIADFNGDGRWDAAVGGVGTLLPGEAGAGFGAPSQLPKPGFLTSADFDRDGVPDLAVAARNNAQGFTQPNLTVHLGDGDGTFTQSQQILLQDNNFDNGRLMAGRLDADAFDDLLLLNIRSNVLMRFLGNGDGSFKPFQTFALDHDPRDLALADLNKDGKLDVVVASQGQFGALDGSLGVLLGDGNGGFSAPVEVFSGAAVTRVAVGDFNGDGNPDLAAACERPQFTDNVAILAGNGNGSFQAPANLPSTTYRFSGVGGLAAVDFNRDGFLDLLVTSGGERCLITFPGTGNGAFGAPHFSDAGDSPGQIAIVDLNLDQKPDVVIPNGGSGRTLTTLLNLSAAPTTHTRLAAPPGGAAHSITAGTTTPLQIGYATATLGFGITPYATRAFILSQNGVVASEVGIPSSPPTRSARIFIDRRSGIPAPQGGVFSTNTGLAAVNPGPKPAKAHLRLRDTQGQSLAEGDTTFEPGTHVAKFVDELAQISTFVLPGGFAGRGSLEITSDQALSLLALRLTTNQRGEALLTSVPIADQSVAPGNDPLHFSQFVNGGGGDTTLILLNTTSGQQDGTIEIRNGDGGPLIVRITGGQQGSTFNYSIPPQGTFLLQTDGAPAAAQIGSVQVKPQAGDTAPTGAGIFQISTGGIIVTEAGIPSSILTSRARVFVDTAGGHNTGLALANPGSAPLSLELRAFQRDGKTQQGPARSLGLPAGGHTAQFGQELISGLPVGFQGVIQVEAGAPFAALTLRTLTNQRGDFLITTFPVADLTRPAPHFMMFPQAADGGGVRSEFIFITSRGEAVLTVNYFDEDGKPVTLGAP